MAWYNFWKKKKEPKKNNIYDDPSLPVFSIKPLGNDYYWMEIRWQKSVKDDEKIALIRNLSSMLTQLQTGQLLQGIQNILISYDKECGPHIANIVNDNVMQFYHMFKQGVLEELKGKMEDAEKVIMQPWQTFRGVNGGGDEE